MASFSAELDRSNNIVIVVVTEDDGSEHDYQFDFDPRSGRWEFSERDLLERDFGEEWVEELEGEVEPDRSRPFGGRRLIPWAKSSASAASSFAPRTPPPCGVGTRSTWACRPPITAHRSSRGRPPGGYQLWSPFEADSSYLGPASQTFAISLMVDDLDACLEQVRAAGAEGVRGPDDTPYGRFGWFIDPEGRQVELWQPPADLPPDVG
ncbi:MAG: hypothetical protein R3E96_11575 [Planctomycetota bacterium]